MPPHFQAMPQTIVEADTKILDFLLAWRDWLAARQSLADDFTNVALHDALADKSVTLRQAFVTMRHHFRYLQQLRHLRGGSLRK